MTVKNKDKSSNTCPICKVTVSEESETYPFCSDRCKKVDMGKWFDGKYTISRPVEQSDMEEGE